MGQIDDLRSCYVTLEAHEGLSLFVEPPDDQRTSASDPSPHGSGRNRHRCAADAAYAAAAPPTEGATQLVTKGRVDCSVQVLSTGCVGLARKPAAICAAHGDLP